MAALIYWSLEIPYYDFREIAGQYLNAEPENFSFRGNGHLFDRHYMSKLW